MSLTKDLLAEFSLEAAVTRRYLTSVPFDKADFQPHEKSEKLGRLAIHIAEIIAWWKESILNEELDFLGFEPKNIQSTDELLTYFDELVHEAKTVLRKAKNKDFKGNWTMKHGEDILFTLPKKQVVRVFCMNHLVHHRAQLGVYLRMLNIAVPAAYGPSADDYEVILTTPFGD